MGLQSLSTCYSNTTPKPVSEASVITLVGLCRSHLASTGASLSSCFRIATASSVLSVYSVFCFFLSPLISSVKGIEIVEKDGINLR